MLLFVCVCGEGLLMFSKLYNMACYSLNPEHPGPEMQTPLSASLLFPSVDPQVLGGGQPTWTFGVTAEPAKNHFEARWDFF